MEAFGAQGITVHPRPDERHVRFADIPALKEIVKTEYNIEGFPSEKFIQLILETRPTQCTLVPDPPEALTSDTGWDTIQHQAFLKDTIQRLHEANIRVSLFLNPHPRMVEGALACGTDRIELYTGPYALQYPKNREKAVSPHVEAAKLAHHLGLGLNAGHDLNRQNLGFYCQQVPHVLEVSIGHALICDALYFGLHNTIQMYLHALNQTSVSMA